MHLDKVINLEECNLGSNQVLVEFIEKKSSIILAGSTGPSSTFERTEVVLSTVEGIEPGDIIIDARFGQAGNIEVLGLTGKKETVGEGKNARTVTVDDRKFTIVSQHDIKFWTKRSNFKLD